MHFVIQIFLCCALVSPILAGTGFIPQYEVGNRARATITTPVPLIVVDQQKTEMLRQQEAARVPAIFRFYPKAVDEAENKLRTAFDNGREKFQNQIQAEFKKPALDIQALAQPKFQQLQSNFQKQNKSFPLTADLVQLWATGESDAAIQTAFAGKLRGVMAGYIRPDTLSPVAKIGPGNGMVVTLPSSGYVLDLETAQKQSFLTNKTSFIAIGKLRNEFINSYPSNEQAVARFIASFIKENLVPDEELTRQARASRTEAIWSADNYEAGQVLVSSNEPITPRIKAALDQLREKMTADSAQAEQAEEKLKAQNKAARFREQALLAKAEEETAAERNWWMAIAGGVVGVVVLLSVLLRLKKKPAVTGLVSMPMVSSQSNIPMLSSVGEGSVVISTFSSPAAFPSAEADAWKERALDAELKAEQLSTVVKAGLLPQLSRWLANKFVSRLALERRQLMETQHRAELVIAEIENRLEQVRAPLEERLRVYEERIQTLEAELAAKAAENQELIKATIVAARRKIEQERSKNLLEFN
jgi:hypothetical protein